MSVGYLICMLGELFAYCWFGNEITLKSMGFSDDIYKIDWMALSDSSNKKLIFIMMRATQPIIMSYGHLVILNIESFKSVSTYKHILSFNVTPND
ncbi:hypothetical protein TSAR_005005 [Trichomalopsis sarcophagae]|uniref:Odorant receptor n=1 Tax=Trichomalopsis sarcophagae TaxID=543379 RepID=A0A232EZT8_9HYME|nr:hypothetical protein TSAR_005005 [Trichomalopsis sarcophagae]